MSPGPKRRGGTGQSDRAITQLGAGEDPSLELFIPQMCGRWSCPFLQYLQWGFRGKVACGAAILMPHWLTWSKRSHIKGKQWGCQAELTEEQSRAHGQCPAEWLGTWVLAGALPCHATSAWGAGSAEMSSRNRQWSPESVPSPTPRLHLLAPASDNQAQRKGRGCLIQQTRCFLTATLPPCPRHMATQHDCSNSLSRCPGGGGVCAMICVHLRE